MNVEPAVIPQSHATERGLDMLGQGLLLYHTAPSLCLGEAEVRLAVPTGRNSPEAGLALSALHLFVCRSGFCLQRAVLSTHQASDPLGPGVQRFLALCPWTWGPGSILPRNQQLSQPALPGTSFP